MKLKFKILISAALVLIGLVTLYLIDPIFKRELIFDDYSAQYEWRIFSNSFCNIRTAGHCYTNETNRTNAEIKLYLTLLNIADGNKRIENKLKEVVRNTYRFDRTYSELTRTNEIQIDSLKKYKNEIFREIILK